MKEGESQIMKRNLIKHVVVYGDFLLLGYHDHLDLDLFKKNGTIIERHTIVPEFVLNDKNKILLLSADFL
jgi:hypothetical protein